MAKNQWFRLYNQTLNNPKVQTLSGDLFKAWVNILCVTSQCDGRDVTRDDLSFHLRMSREQTDQIVNELVAANLLVGRDEIIPYHWDERQYKSDSSADRTRLYRERKKKDSDGNCDVTVTPVVTPPDTESDTDTEEEHTPSATPQKLCPHQKIIELYHEHCPDLPRIRSWEGTRRENLKMRFKSKTNLEWWTWFFKTIHTLDFYNGRTDSDRDWKANLEWIVKLSNFQKMMDKCYEQSNSA